jgi:hypothetical protein
MFSTRMILATTSLTQEALKTPLQIQEETKEFQQEQEKCDAIIQSFLEHLKQDTDTFFNKANQSLAEIEKLPVTTLTQVYGKSDQFCGLARLIQIYEKRLNLQFDELSKKIKIQQPDFKLLQAADQLHKDAIKQSEDLLSTLGKLRTNTQAGHKNPQFKTGENRPRHIGLKIGTTQINEMSIDIYAQDADFQCFLAKPYNTTEATRLRIYFCHGEAMLADFMLTQNYGKSNLSPDYLLSTKKSSAANFSQICFEQPRTDYGNPQVDLEQLHYKIYQVAFEIALQEKVEELSIWENSCAEYVLHACGFDTLSRFFELTPAFQAAIKEEFLQGFQEKIKKNESFLKQKTNSEHQLYTIKIKDLAKPCLYLKGKNTPTTWQICLESHQQLVPEKSKLPLACGMPSVLPENYDANIYREKIDTNKVDDLSYLLSIGQAHIPHRDLREASPDIEIFVYRAPAIAASSNYQSLRAR